MLTGTKLSSISLTLSPQVLQQASQPANENNLWKIFQEFVNSVIPSAYALEIGSYSPAKVSNSILNDWRRPTKAVIVENPIPEAADDMVDTVTILNNRQNNNLFSIPAVNPEKPVSVALLTKERYCKMLCSGMTVRASL